MKYVVIYGLSTIQRLEVSAENEKEALASAEQLLSKIADVMNGDTFLIEALPEEEEGNDE